MLPFHRHDVECEMWIIISAVGEVRVGEEHELVRPEAVVLLLRNIKHQIINTGQETLRKFWIYTPPGGERSILEREIKQQKLRKAPFTYQFFRLAPSPFYIGSKR